MGESIQSQYGGTGWEYRRIFLRSCLPTTDRLSFLSGISSGPMFTFYA